MGFRVVFLSFSDRNCCLLWSAKEGNEWIYLSSWGSMEDKYTLLPPGDLGWPFIGNMLSFFRAFKSGDPDSFISSFTSRFGQAPMYRAFLFGKPSIIVSDGETVRKVLTDERFGPFILNHW
ncbi:hypothetical protein M9H77_00328 [Catharanthus roseus]|nr:hypothetical protein M9H77_00328 [Catharanthus roseus]